MPPTLYMHEWAPRLPAIPTRRWLSSHNGKVVAKVGWNNAEHWGGLVALIDLMQGPQKLTRKRPCGRQYR